MTGFSRTNRSLIAEWSRTVDTTILSASVLLIGCGFILSLAAGPVAAARIGYDDPFFLVYRHASFACAAVLALFVFSMLNEVWTRRVAAVILVVALLQMAAVLVVGHQAKGASRWLHLAGFSFQPSEIVKPALIVTTAWFLEQRPVSKDIPWASLAVSLYAATVLLLMMQPDVGQAALISAVFMILFFISGLTLRWTFLFGSTISIVATLSYLLLPHVRYRVHSFINPENFDTYQVDTAVRAIASGGLTGKGPGEGMVKAHLPDAHTDFIFAVACEEFGIIAGAGLIALYAAIVFRGLNHAAGCSDPFVRTASAGLISLFAMQAAINIGVNLALLPPKGMTLPLVSYGGSSMLGSAVTLGLALALARGHPRTSHRRPARIDSVAR